MKRMTGWICVVSILLTVMQAQAEEKVLKGDTLEQVIKIYGEPKGRAQGGDSDTVMYYFDHGGITFVTFKNGKVVGGESISAAEVKERREEIQEAAEVRKKREAAMASQAPSASSGTSSSGLRSAPDTSGAGEKPQGPSPLEVVTKKIAETKKAIAEATEAANRLYAIGGTRKRRAARLKRDKLEKDLAALEKERARLQKEGVEIRL